MRRNGEFRAHVIPSKEQHQRPSMKDVIKFREYAEDCRRLAKSMKPEHKATLLEIADAWDRVAEERERQGGKEEPGEKEIEASRE
jgi:hypothetical protein